MTVSAQRPNKSFQATPPTSAKFVVVAKVIFVREFVQLAVSASRLNSAVRWLSQPCCCYEFPYAILLSTKCDERL